MRVQRLNLLTSHVNFSIEWWINPLNAIFKANFIGVLAWSIGLGLALRHASDGTKQVVVILQKAFLKLFT